jgi:hypothetical protein
MNLIIGAAGPVLPAARFAGRAPVLQVVSRWARRALA